WVLEHFLFMAAPATASADWTSRRYSALYPGADRLSASYVSGLSTGDLSRCCLVSASLCPLRSSRAWIHLGPDRVLPGLEILGWILQRSVRNRLSIKRPLRRMRIDGECSRENRWSSFLGGPWL